MTSQIDESHAENAFYALAGVVERFVRSTQNPPEKVNAVLEEILPAMEPIAAKQRIYGMFRDCIEAISLLELPSNDLLEIENLLKDHQALFFRYNGLAGVAELVNHTGFRGLLPLVKSYGHSVRLSSKRSGEALDREALAKKTLNLLRSFKESDLSDYEKNAVALKMNSIVRISVEGSVYTDAEIRNRVKAIYADFCAQFDQADKKHASYLDKMKHWALRACGLGTSALAITSDAQEAYKMLENFTN